jgi:hypothetical protein
MNAKRQALRLAIYLDVIGMVPECGECRTWKDVAANLSLNFLVLPADLKREAKINARGLIRQEGMEPLARAILSLHPLLTEIATNSHLPSQPKCDHCRSRWQLKATWDSREAAEEFSRTNSMSGLRAFPCPAHPDNWHMGHGPKRSESR